jgi:pimeloyl-ACP methyl ester carboxylesterase
MTVAVIAGAFALSILGQRDSSGAYRTEEVVVRGASPGVMLAGTLTIPAGGGQRPATVLLSVAGPNDRDQQHGAHRPYAVLADYLARRGVVVLRLDDRGVGGSTGSWLSATTEDLAGDAIAATAFLAERAEVDPRRIGVTGNSLGGAVGALAAARSERVGFVIMLGGIGLRGPRVIRSQAERGARALGLPDSVTRRFLERTDSLLAIVGSGTDSVVAAARIRAVLATPEGPLLVPPYRFIPRDPDGQAGVFLSPWYRSQVTLDPARALRAIRVPVLALTGTLDRIVPASENFPPMREALASSGTRDVTFIELPGVNHVMQPAVTGDAREYATLPESFAPAALRAIGDWLAARFGP